MLCRDMESVLRPITHKKDAPEDKDPPEGKELSNLCSVAIFIESGYTPIVIVITC